VAPSQVLAVARQAFGAKDYAQTDTLLQSLVADGHGEAMMLAADANFALATPRSLRRAINLYERCLYEDSSIPFPDHSYHQLAQIYLLQSQQARDQGQLYEAREMASEATFYLSRLIKKYPDSYYRDTSLNALLDQALERHKYEDVRRWAQTIWSSATDSRLLSRVEPIVFINQEPFNASLAELRETYARHPDFIHRSRNLLLEYAKPLASLTEPANFTCGSTINGPRAMTAPLPCAGSPTCIAPWVRWTRRSACTA
jgi:tetratricopeptide (TPR) repeat protein